MGDLTHFTRFIRACAARTGHLLNLSDLARDVDISVPTAKSWLSVLVAGFQVYLLQPYHSNLTKRIAKHPKLYFLDTGLCSYLTQWTSPETLAAGAMAGAILETHILSEILKSWWHNTESPSLYFYRDKDRREIDFVLSHDDKLYPIEVKRGATPGADWVKSFSALDRLRPARGIGTVVCLADRTRALSREARVVPVWDL